MADRKKEQIIVSSSMIKFNVNEYVYNPQFDLGIGEEWLPKYPVMASQANVTSLLQDNSNEFWSTIGCTISSPVMYYHRQ